MIRTAIAILVVSAVNPTVFAHDLRPSFIDLSAEQGGQAVLRWKVPGSVPRAQLPEVALAGACEPAGEIELFRDSATYQGRRGYACPAGVAGQALALRFPAANPSLTTVVRVSPGDGQTHSGLLAPGILEWTIPERATRWGVARSYTELGIEHIWLGWDHLLFVACLVLIARTGRRILITITGFTLAHSLTLALSTLNLVSLPIPAVEAAIALSIVFVATEIARGNEATLTHRYPVVVASSIGLLHGFGFASVLREVGLPAAELPTALLFFNVGVEIGQLLFVVVILVGARALRRWKQASAAAPELDEASRAGLGVLAAYGIGVLASFWTLERVLGFWA